VKIRIYSRLWSPWLKGGVIGLYFTTFFVIIAISYGVYEQMNQLPAGGTQQGIAIITFPVFVPLLMFSLVVDSLLPFVHEVVTVILGLLLTYVFYFSLGTFIGWVVSIMRHTKDKRAV